MKYYLGIDGGGTRTTAAVSDNSGKILLKKTGKTINFYSVGMHTAKENLDSLINTVSNEIGCNNFEGVFIGCSALDSEADEKTLSDLCSGINAKNIAMNSDLYIALKSLDSDKCPCVAVCGTGSMAIGEDTNGHTVIAGGWGHIIGDEGSGYSIAVNAFNKCCELCDEGVSTPLLEAANEFFAINDFRKAIDIIYSSETTKDIIAGFAEKVSDVSEFDISARNIVIEEAHKFAKTVIILLQKVKSCKVLGLYGGIFQHNPLFRQTFESDIKTLFPLTETKLLTTPPEESALKLARELK